MLKRELADRQVGVLEGKADNAAISGFEKEYREMYKSIRERKLMEAK
jgi:hypothetical protein